MTSAATGASFATMGMLLLNLVRPTTLAAVAIATAVWALVRESGVVHLPLPQIRRQTRGAWARNLGPTRAAALWGLDLGLTFSTWLTFAGAWVIAAAALSSASWTVGGGIFMAYWAGRLGSVLLAPAFVRNLRDLPALLDHLNGRTHWARRTHVAGLITMIAALLVT